MLFCGSAHLLGLYLSGLIHVGDELREVNGIPVEDKRPEEIIKILVSCYLFVNLRFLSLV